jgi:lipopolysaccharide transport system ATP-binding protein
MTAPIIEVTGLSKRSRLGSLGARSLREEAEQLWHRLRQPAAETPTRAQDFWALRDVSFTVQPGEVVGVIGRNGAGKSTLLKILSRITEPTAGEAVLRGRVASLLEVGTGFHPELSGRENIFLNGAILGMKRAEIARKLDEIVAFAEIERFLDTPVKRYSSGMYVRLAFAVAAHLEPEILIIDEVLAVGDVQFQKKCLGKMREVSTTSGRTVLFVSHNMEAVATLCTRALLMHEGRAEPFARAAEAIAAYVAAGPETSQRWSGQAGDETLSLLETWVESRGPALESGAPIEIGLRYRLHRQTEGLIIGYQLFSEFGYELIYSLHDDATPGDPEPDAPGEYLKRFVIPANTLAAGGYRVAFDLGVHMVKRIIEPPHGELEFTLENVTGIGRRYLAPNLRGYRSLFRPGWPVETQSGPP